MNSRRGSALLASMIVVTILSFAAAGILSYSMNTYRNSIRQAALDQAREIADGEMEVLYYQWKDQLISKVAVSNVQAHLTTAGQNYLTNSTPFSSKIQNLYPTGSPQWTVTRSIAYNYITGTSDGSAQGLDSTGTQVAKNYYYTAQTSASINLPLVGQVTFHAGRHFTYSSTSLFQFAVFYQGNLEMAAGGNLTIGGPVTTNASAYLGAGANGGNPFQLTLTDKVNYFQDYNGKPDPLSGETLLLEGTTALVDPIYNPNPQGAEPDQPTQRALQVNKLAAQYSFVGGVDVAADLANSTYQQAYQNLQGTVDPNEIYRAVIAPPPVDSNNVALPEDPVVAGSRMYNSAGILITIAQTAPGAPTTSGTPNTVIHVGYASSDPNTLHAYDADFPTIVNPNTAVDSNGHPTSIIQGVRSTVVDPREYLNGVSSVNMTTVDVGNLNTALTTALTSDPTLAANYNGVVYVYDKTNNNGTNGQTAINPSTLNAVRLTNATTTPNVSDQNGNPLGFTVVSDNGVYVQGDYNTTQIPVSTGYVNNPAALMGDMVTVLSQGWSQSANSTLQAIDPNREATPSAPLPANGVNPGSLGTQNGMTVNAAILTGNTPSTSTTNSGGAQNLVRMIEDWYYPDPMHNGTGLALTLNGSLGQLFTSKYFSSNFANGAQTGLGQVSPGVYNRVYIQPKQRIFNYDVGFKTRTPAGSPTTTGFSRGDFFFW
jgi:type II secretory pathway pseudopilin PulG